MSQTIGRTWRQLRDRLADAGIATPALDARLLVRHGLDFDETGLIAAEPQIFPEEKRDALEATVSRRLSGEPVARILGEQEFFGLAFGLSAATLVPRPETEMLVDFGLVQLGGKPEARLLDLGTGTGCIAIALLVNLPGATAVAVDISAPALDKARANGERNGVSGRLATHHGSWFEPVAGETFDLIVSNPPYIASAVIETLDPGVRDHDPMAALDGGNDGLDPYRIIVRSARNHLKPDGALALEIGFDQGHMVCALLKEAGFSDIGVAKDLAGHDRMVTAKARK